MARPRTALTISFSDPTGMDGAQADLKAFASLGLHGAAVVTAVGSEVLSAAAVASQIDVAFGAMTVDVVKVEAPPDAALVEAIAQQLRQWGAQRVVLDPAHSNDGNGAASVLEALRQHLLPLTEIATPNLSEAEALSSRAIKDWDDAREAARAIAALGARNVVIKGGKREGEVVTDLLFDGADFREYSATRVPEVVRGAGAAFAAALAATLAKGETVEHSVAAAKAYVTKGLQNAYELGDCVTLHHFYRYWHT